MDQIYKDQIESLKNTVKACKAGFNDDQIFEFRNWLRHFPDTTLSNNLGKVYIMDPNRLRAFVQHLSEEHAKYRNDAILYGSVAAISGICECCAAAQEQSDKSEEIAPLTVYNSIGLILSSDPETNPIKLLSGTVYKAVENGFSAAMWSWFRLIEQKSRRNNKRRVELRKVKINA